MIKLETLGPFCDECKYFEAHTARLYQDAIAITLITCENEAMCSRIEKHIRDTLKVKGLYSEKE